jgi:hypothetical protein
MVRRNVWNVTAKHRFLFSDGHQNDLTLCSSLRTPSIRAQSQPRSSHLLGLSCAFIGRCRRDNFRVYITVQRFDTFWKYTKDHRIHNTTSNYTSTMTLFPTKYANLKPSNSSRRLMMTSISLIGRSTFRLICLLPGLGVLSLSPLLILTSKAYNILLTKPISSVLANCLPGQIYFPLP